MSERVQEIISVSDVADGNPSTAMALANQLCAAGGDLIEVYLTFTSIPVNYFHRDISADANEAREYTEVSEERRLDRTSRLYAAACFGEFSLRLALNQEHSMKIPGRWNIVQEHQLLGASQRILKWLGIADIRVAVPDVFPKESAKHAVAQIPRATFSVWNVAAQRELTDEGFEVELHKPYLLDGFRPNIPEFYDEGMNVVVKTSGNGMPHEWQNELKVALSGCSDITWGFHTPKGRTSHKFEVMMRYPKYQRLQNFYNDLGGRTRVLIGYPSELVGLACDMRERGVSVWMITLPPRGAHEWRNLQFAMENQLVIGELAPRDYSHPPTFSDLEAIPMAMLPDTIANLPEPKWSESIVGTKPFWSNTARVGCGLQGRA